MELKRGRRLKGASSCLEDQRTSHLRYCELDTLAMVMIYEHLKELVN